MVYKTQLCVRVLRDVCLPPAVQAQGTPMPTLNLRGWAFHVLMWACVVTVAACFVLVCRLEKYLRGAHVLQADSACCCGQNLELLSLSIADLPVRNGPLLELLEAVQLLGC